VTVNVFNKVEAGLAPTCGTQLTGVAVGGTLARPDIVTNSSFGCPATRINSSSGVIAVPVVK